MIYADTSVLLAWLLTEERGPPPDFWDGPLVASRLVEYETWNRVRAYGAEGTHGDSVRALLGRLAFIELRPSVLERALEPFPTPVRTLDALHLASAWFLRERVRDLRIATYDRRLSEAGCALEFDVFEP